MNRDHNEKKYVANPYLPGWEYVPDGEPHVFGDRVYVYGSHDRAHGTGFCQEDYVCWSAPVDDLTQWRHEGVIYRKDQDMHNKEKMKELWAPDVCRGTDGRYYLYYCCAFVPEIGIAVCDEPAGKYEFYDYVRDENGAIWDRDLPFDPAVLYEDPDHIWLYSGFGTEPMVLPEGVTMEQVLQATVGADASQEVIESIKEQMEVTSHPSKQASCLRLSSDMKTVIACTGIAPAKHYAKGTDFEAHPFFEASSIRKYKDTYYFVYSAFQGHELCYATSKYPDKEFRFGGVIISNADIGYQGNEKYRAYCGNNHGGIEQINGQWYIFYHRQTNGSMFSRQGCAEPIEILEDGSIPQVEITSCGLNQGPLPAKEAYSAHICCNLMGPDGACEIDVVKGLAENDPYITEETVDGVKNQYIHNMHSGTVAGFKYIEFNGENNLYVTARGTGKIQLVLDDENQNSHAELEISSSSWEKYQVSFPELAGIHAVYLRTVDCQEALDISDFQFSKIGE